MMKKKSKATEEMNLARTPRARPTPAAPIPIAKEETNMPSICKLYRHSSVGMGLIDALDELVTHGTISRLVADRVLLRFDKSINDALSQRVKRTAKFMGHLNFYRFCENDWTFSLENVELVLDNVDRVRVDRLKIVAHASKRRRSLLDYRSVSNRNWSNEV